MQISRGKSVTKWMSCGMERISSKLERLKPTCSGYNRIQPILLSKSVAHMLNNPLPVKDQMGRRESGPTAAKQAKNNHTMQPQRTKGVLSISETEWEEVYPTVKFYRCTNHQSRAQATEEKPIKFAYYRNCSTRIT